MNSLDPDQQISGRVQDLEHWITGQQEWEQEHLVAWLFGAFAVLAGLNIVGMKRRKFSRQRLAAVRSFYQKLFHGPGMFAERLNEARQLSGQDPAIAEILNFIDAAKHRELCQPIKQRNGS